MMKYKKYAEFFWVLENGLGKMWKKVFSVGCVIPLDRLRFPFNNIEISMVDICILDVLIISILELFHAFFRAHKRGKAHFSALMSMEKLHVYHLGL